LSRPFNFEVFSDKIFWRSQNLKVLYFLIPKKADKSIPLEEREIIMRMKHTNAILSYEMEDSWQRFIMTYFIPSVFTGIFFTFVAIRFKYR
jgi:hypothetical protein